MFSYGWGLVVKTCLLRKDRYEDNVDLYWVEEDVEGKWQKNKSTSRSEQLDYEVPLDPEDVPTTFGASNNLNWDPASMQGLCCTY